MLGDTHFDADVLGVVQSDIWKWGGFSKVTPLARRIVNAGAWYCPHFLAGPIGILASAHCLAAAGGNGILEIDNNPNPLRDTLTGGIPTIVDGLMELPSGAELGMAPDADVIKEFRVA